jgi:hypothetical protein
MILIRAVLYIREASAAIRRIACSGFSLADSLADSSVRYAASAFLCLRFQDRGQRDFYTVRRGAQLGAKKFTLADADGSRLLRNRINGDGCVAIRYRPVWRRSDAILAKTMRRDDRRRDRDLQNGTGSEKNL